MKKINYALIGIIISLLILGALYNEIPKVLVPDINQNIQYLEGLEIDDYIDLSNVVTMIGYQLYSNDIDNRLSSNVFAYGRSNPMYFIKINIPKLEEEHKDLTNGGNDTGGAKNKPKGNRYYIYPYSGGEEFYSKNSESNLSTYIDDYNFQFSRVNKNNILGYNKRTSDAEIIPLGSLLTKIRNDLRLPVDQKYLSISSKFGARVDPFNYNTEPIKTSEDLKLLPFHTGLDISEAGINGANVYSMLDGTVKRISNGNTGYGNLVVIDHGAFETYYAHMSSIRADLREGSFVLAGENIGQVGSTGRSTGPHLHVEFVFDNKAVNPELFIPATAFNIKTNEQLNPTSNFISKLNFKDIKSEEKIKEDKALEINKKEGVTKVKPVVKPSYNNNTNKKPVSNWRPKPVTPSVKKPVKNHIGEPKLEEKKEDIIELEPLPEIDDNWRNE